MATLKQKKALAKIIENRGNVSKAMREVGYRPATAVNPKNLTDSDGFQELCNDYGLTNDLLIKSLVSDIKKKPKNRKPELELGFKVKGHLKDNEKPGDTYNTIVFTGEQAARIARRILTHRPASPARSD